jgi:hypothetical protein
MNNLILVLSEDLRWREMRQGNPIGQDAHFAEAVGCTWRGWKRKIVDGWEGGEDRFWTFARR